MYFYDGISLIPQCLLRSRNFSIVTDDSIKCGNHGEMRSMMCALVSYFCFRDNMESYNRGTGLLHAS